jgi:hypothetical protein
MNGYAKSLSERSKKFNCLIFLLEYGVNQIAICIANVDLEFGYRKLSRTR